MLKNSIVFLFSITLCGSLWSQQVPVERNRAFNQNLYPVNLWSTSDGMEIHEALEVEYTWLAAQLDTAEKVFVRDHFEWAMHQLYFLESSQVSTGRKGLWQLPIGPALHQGLAVNDTIDERLDPIKSTQAAWGHFNWLLATGLDSNQAWEQLLYVPVSEAMHPTLDLSSETEIDLSIDTVQHLLSVNVLVQYLGVSVEKFKTVNPHVLDGWVLPQCHYFAEQSWKVPNDSVWNSLYLESERLNVLYAENLNKTRENLKANIPDPKTHTATVYKVRSGDNLGRIAQKYRVKVSEIKDWNDLSSDRIYVGQKLMLYTANKPGGATAKSQPAENKKKPETAKSTKKETSKTVLKDGEYTLYTVKSGDSLWLIAQKYPGVSAENIMEWNNIGTDIQPGQQLKIKKLK